MRPDVPFIIVAASGLGTAAAATNLHNTYTVRICTTVHAFRPVGTVPTKFSTMREPFTILSTQSVRSTVTMTPSTVTSTIKKTKVVKTQTTKTANPPATKQIDTTVYTTVTATAKACTTTVQKTVQTDNVVKSTTTVSTAAGFVPIQTSLQGAVMDTSDGVPMKRHIHAHKHRSHARAGAPMDAKPKKGPPKFVKPGAAWVVTGGQGIAPQGRPQFPQRVDCKVVLQIPKIVTRIKKCPPATVTGPAPTAIKIQNVTVTSTSTVFPTNVAVSVTSTVTSTITSSIVPTTTATETVTNTNVVNMPQATRYARCSRENMANRRGNSWLVGGLLSDNNYGLDVMNADSPYDCCAACAKRDDCIASIMVGNGTCQVLTKGTSTCTPSTPCLGSVYLRATEGDDWVTFFNAPAVVWNQASSPLS